MKTDIKYPSLLGVVDVIHQIRHAFLYDSNLWPRNSAGRFRLKIILEKLESLARTCNHWHFVHQGLEEDTTDTIIVEELIDILNHLPSIRKGEIDKESFRRTL